MSKKSESQGRSKAFWIGLLVLGVLLLGVVFLGKALLIKYAENFFLREVSKHGLYVSYDERKISLSEGLVLKGLTLYEDEAKTVPVLRFDRVGFEKKDPEYGSEEIAGYLSMDQGKVIIYGKDEAVLSVDELFVRMHVEEFGLRCDELRGSVGDLEINLEGVFQANPAKEREQVVLRLAQFDERTAEALQLVAEGEKRPKLELRFQVDESDFDLVDIEGSFQGENFRSRRLLFDSAELGFRQKGQNFDMGPCLFHFAEGKVEMRDVAAQLREGKSQVGSFSSDINPIALAKMLEPERAEEWAMWTVRQAPVIEGRGWEFHEGAREENRFELEIGGGSDLHRKGEETDLRIRDVEGRIIVADGSMKIPSMTAEVGDGRARLEAESSFRPNEDPSYQFSLKTDALPLGELTWSHKKGKSEMEGLMSLDVRGEGVGEGPEGLDLSGQLVIEKGRFFALPLFSGLADLLKVGAGGRQKLESEFRVNEGEVFVDSLELTGATSKMNVKGTYDLEKNEVHLVGSANFRGAVGLATKFLSKMLEIEAVGPPDQLEWRLRNFGGGAKKVEEEQVPATEAGR